MPREYLRSCPGRSVTKVINSRRWNIYFSFEGDNAKQLDLFRFDGSSTGLIRQHSLPRHRSIFIHFIHGTVSSSYFTNRERNWSRFIRVPIEPRITYFGVGQGVIPRSFTDDIYMPKFFVSHIKSKEDIKTRIQLILTWIEQRPQLFEALNYYQPFTDPPNLVLLGGTASTISVLSFTKCVSISPHLLTRHIIIL